MKKYVLRIYYTPDTYIYYLILGRELKGMKNITCQEGAVNLALYDLEKKMVSHIKREGLHDSQRK